MECYSKFTSVKISDDSPIFQFYSGRGVAVDNNPESPFFGRVYVSESAGGLISEGTPVNPRTTQKGIYILDAALSDVTNQGAKSYTGNIAMPVTNMLQEELQQMPPVKFISPTVHLVTQEFT